MFNYKNLIEVVSKHIYALIIVIFCIIQFWVGFLLFEKNSENLTNIDTTNEVSVILVELNSVFKSKTSLLNEYINAPVQTHIEAYDLLVNSYKTLFEKIILEQQPKELSQSLLELYSMSKSYDDVFYSKIFPKMDKNLRKEVELDRIEIWRISAEYQERHRYTKNLLESYMENSVSQYKRFLYITLFILIILFLSLLILFLFIVSNLKYKKLLNEKTIELKKALKELMRREKIASLSVLVAGIAHEINTPLGNSILTISYMDNQHKQFMDKFNAQQITKSDLNNYLTKIDESISLAASSLDKVAILVDTFKKLSLNTVEDDNLRLFNIKECVQTTLFSFRSDYEKNHHTINLDCPNDLTIYGSSRVCSQIISNLVMNSIVHGFKDISHGTINIFIERTNEELIINYTDNGSGLKDEIKSKIFDPFFTTSRHKGGIGLGLNIVYNLVVERLNGSIDFESQFGFGIKFTIHIPILDKALIDKK